jgi:hypothetical protein
MSTAENAEAAVMATKAEASSAIAILRMKGGSSWCGVTANDESVPARRALSKGNESGQPLTDVMRKRTSFAQLRIRRLFRPPPRASGLAGYEAGAGPAFQSVRLDIDFVTRRRCRRTHDGRPTTPSQQPRRGITLARFGWD